jgi:hypothetical protein
MTDTTPNAFDGQRARMREQAAESRRRNDALRTLADAVEAATGSARSQDGTITVTASSSGAITAIHLTDDAVEKAPAVLASELVKVVAAAQSAALATAAALSAAQLGDSHPLVWELETSAQRYAAPEPPLGYR